MTATPVEDPPVEDPPREGLAGRLWRWFAAHSDSLPVVLLRRAVHGLLPFLHAENHDIRTNGECVLLDRLGNEATVVFDVGACRGDWALEAAARCRRARILCFEVAGPTREMLRAAVGGEARIRVMTGGLAARAGPVEIKYYPTEPALSSLFDYPHGAPAERRPETVSTLDAVLAETGIERIDLLKIDAEGAELGILEGGREALAAGRIRAIQFEYGYAAVLSHGLLRDFHALLEPLGYEIGKLGRRGVDFRPYRFADENFFGPNFVAVRREETALAERLRLRR